MARFHGHRLWMPLLLLAVLATLSLVSSYEFYAPFLPDRIAANETITHVEIRLYLSQEESSTPDLQIRVFPTSESITFSQESIVFTPTSPVAKMLSMVAHTAGVVSISYFVQVEKVLNATAVEVMDVATQVSATQEIHVLSPPLSYRMDDPQWHGVVLLNDSFENDAFSVNSSSLWGTIKHGYASASCGSYDGSNALYFTALGDRLAMTKPLPLQGFEGKLHFQHVYGFHAQGQEYDSRGDNRVSCEKVDKGEEIIVSYLPLDQDENNASAWKDLQELEVASSTTFGGHTVSLPMAAMHGAARFRWQQKSHSSFPVDPVPGLSLATILTGENDDTSIDGQLGIAERELWKHRNLFDQWALDDVQLEVRLNPPVFALLDQDGVAVNGSTVVVAVGSATVLVDSPVVDTWVEWEVGDGTHAFPSCDPLHATTMANIAETVRLNGSGYVHAIACLVIHHEHASSVVISSFPTRSTRVLVQARPPVLAPVVDTTTSVDTWTIQLSCDGCAFMRYTAVTTTSSSDKVDVARVAPSCSYGTLVDGTSGTFQISANHQIFAVACGAALLPSEMSSTDLLVVAPREPRFEYLYTSTTITNAFNVTIMPPSLGLGISYTVNGEGEEALPRCRSSSGEVVVPEGDVTIVVHVSDVIRAVSCCVDVHCADSTVATWGPIDVQTVAPLYSMACSAIHPLTMVVQITPVTQDAWIQYYVQDSTSSMSPLSLDCREHTTKTPFLFSKDTPIQVSMRSTSVFAVSCLTGLGASDPVEIQIVLDHCCAGLDAVTFPSCAHVLLFHDDFSTSTTTDCLDPAKWQALTTQWGGTNVNGGVHSGNIQCIYDPTRAKHVLQLTANGDFLSSGGRPVGQKRVATLDGSIVVEDRTVDDHLLEWALDGISPTPCQPNDSDDKCTMRRVGAALQTASLKQNAGVVIVKLRPCDSFGTLTQIWWGDYASKDATETNQPVPFLPLWKAGMYQAKTTPQVSFVVSSPSSSQEPLDSDTNDAFMEIVMQWDATLGKSNLYVNGQLVHKQEIFSSASLLNEPLAIGVWFPNAVAGEPLFDKCHVVVDDVRVLKPEITGNRWCELEKDAALVVCETDGDCAKWVENNCFMPIHEAVCIGESIFRNLESVAVELSPSSDGDHQQGGDEARGGATEEEEEEVEQPPKSYCHFRLQPSGAPFVSATSPSWSSRTEMTQRSNSLE